MSQAYKVCPQCQTPAVLTAPQCSQCGHLFRTQFVQQTQVVVPPLHVSPLPQLAELERQYKVLCHAGYACCFFLTPCAGLGILISLLLWQQMAQIKRRVVELGVPVEEWEVPLKEWVFRIGLVYFGIFLIVAYFMLKSLLRW
jgi:hypothetical protein